jgi:hypothetical protein
MKVKLVVILAVILVAIADAFKYNLPNRFTAARNGIFMTSSNKKFSVGIVGATGAVGEEILKVMETRNFPASRISLFASEKSAGKVIESSLYGKLKLEEFTFELASQLDVCLLAVGGDFSLEWAEKLASKGKQMIFTSSMSVPLSFFLSFFLSF